MTEPLDLFVIGGGSAGVRAARFAADYGTRVALAEDRYLGGTCVNVGCVPKKLLVYGSQFGRDFAYAPAYGWTPGLPAFDWPGLIASKDREIARLNGIYRRLLLDAGVTVLDGRARLLDAHTVEVNGQRHRARHILIATGGWPRRPDIPGQELGITSNEAFHLKTLPRRVLIVGGGYIAAEFAGIFNGLGVQTTLVHRGDLFLRGFDRTVREHLRDEFRRQHIELRPDAEPVAIESAHGSARIVRFKDGRTVDTDCVFFATGRRPMLDGLGLENTGVELDARGHVKVDARFRTREPSILAVGDVIGRVQLTPVALAEGMAVARQLFAPAESQPLDYDRVPTAVFTQPNIGAVGLTEEAAAKAGHRVRVFESRFRPLKLTLTTSQERTLMKLVVDADSDRVLGCHMVGPDAGEIVQGLAVALTAGATKSQFDATLGIHPTTAEEFVTMRTARAG